MKQTAIKKLLSVCLAAALLSGVCALFFTASAEDDAIKFALGTDIHIENNKTGIDSNYPESELYFHASGSGNLYDQAEELTREFLRRSVDEGAQFILLSGDLTRHGNAEQHRFVSSLLSEFENETGIQVYVVPGNHDYYASKPAEFREFYFNLGYDSALAEDTATASYTADLLGNYRLIAVDSNDPGEDGDGFNDSLLGWIQAQAEKAQADGRKIIYMMHHPLLEHLYLGKVLMKDFMLRDSKAVAEKFTQWGIQYVFSGHEHGNDIASFTGSNGSIVYDTLTTALSSYPLEYRMITMTDDGADISMRKIEKCNLDKLIDGYTDAQKELLVENYEEFAYGLFKYATEKKILKYVSPAFIKGKLKAESGPLSAAVDTLFYAVNEALTMPLYGSGESVSIEKLAKSKGVSLPQSGYASLIDLATSMVAMHYYGDENMKSGETPECEILVKGLNTGLEYILSKTGKSGLNLLLSIIGTEIPTDELSPLFSAVSLGREDSYKVAGRVLYPLLDKFAVDSGEADRDVYLPSHPDTADNEPATPFGFLNRIIEFFRKIYNMFLNFFKQI
ncbi:MAG: metallophosphoesterase [Clostridia bacterium]|nr:metallophosphoesterase [Clostridia bacterium]